MVLKIRPVKLRSKIGQGFVRDAHGGLVKNAVKVGRNIRIGRRKRYC